MNKKRLDPEQRAILRAKRSLTCLPFRKVFYEEIDRVSISAEELCGRKNWEKFVFAQFGPERAEKHFQWMIKLGILRREVDGQGLTSRVRLTPLGRKVISGWKGEIKRAAIRERLFEKFSRMKGGL
jgi:hypothetical protein